MEELAKKIQEYLEKEFPNNYVDVYAQRVLLESVVIEFAIEKRIDWPHGYIQNATYTKIMIHNLHENGKETDKGQPLGKYFSYEYIAGDRSLKTRAKKITDETGLMNHIKNQFEKLKPVIQAGTK